MMINRRDAETQSKYIAADLTEQIVGAAIAVHSALGPGLLESAYEECLCRELTLRAVPFRRQVELPVSYKGVNLDCGYRIDLLVNELVVIELKCVDKILPVHIAQLLTYMKLSSKEVGLLFNFHTHLLSRGGIIRRALSQPPSLCASASLR
jgi:GxxExxY protein